MAELVLKIQGMSCGHCAMSVKKAIDSLKGVSSSDVSVGTAKVVYDGSQLKKEDIEAAVVKAGYKIT